MGRKWYLQTEGETERLILSDEPTGLETGLPKRGIKLGNIAGNGGFVSGGGRFEGRKINCTKIFFKSDEDDRDDFIANFSKPIYKTQYLYKVIDLSLSGSITAFADAGGGKVTVTSAGHGLSAGDSVEITGTTNYNEVYAITNVLTNTFEITATFVSTETGTFQEVWAGRLRGKGSPGGGEKYSIKRTAYSDEVSFDFLTGDYAYISISEQEESESITGTTLNQPTFTLLGNPQPVTFEFTASADFTLFQVTLDEGFGFRATSTFVNGDVITVETGESELIMKVNGNRVFNVFDNESTPFELEKGDNVLDVYATTGTLKIKYNERRL